MAYQNLARRLKFLIGNARRNGLDHVIEVFRQAYVRRRYAAAPTSPAASDNEILVSLGLPDDPHNAFKLFLQGASRRLPISPTNRKDFLISLLGRIESNDLTLDDASLVSEGRFPALGICINEPDGKFDWNRDYSSGKVWPQIPYHQINFMGDDGADVKYVWELSRMYWIGWLGKAYWSTGNTAWAADFRRLIDSWKQASPFNTGVNWAMPMEIGIRGFWLMMGVGLFGGAPTIDPAWWIGYLRLAWQHALHLESNLEYFSNLTNHYIANCLGLLALGLLFQNTPQGHIWFTEGRRRLVAELDHQILPDGVHYERSIAYHGLVLEMFLIGMVLARNGNAPLAADAVARIRNMALFTATCTNPSGSIPQFGDSDDSTVLRLSATQNIYDHRGILALAAALFDDPEIRAVAGEFSMQGLIILGGEGYERFRRIIPGINRTSRLFGNSGFAVLRSEHLHIVADVGEIGLHGNNDTLSFTLSSGPTDFIVDPGTYCYTRDANTRNSLRSSRAHNAPVVDDMEIAEFDGLWRVRRDTTNTQIEDWMPGDSEGLSPVRLTASHHAWQHRHGITVRRSWEVDERGLHVTDTIEGSGEHTIATTLTIPSPLFVERVAPEVVEILESDGAQLRIEASTQITITQGWYSPSYGVAAEATLVCVKQQVELPTTMQWAISIVE